MRNDIFFEEFKDLKQDELNVKFIFACKNGFLDMVRYLLVCPDLNEHADIHMQCGLGFREACKNGQLEVVKYLLSSSDLKEHSNIHSQDDDGFTWACFNKHFNVVQFLIFEMNIEKTKIIEKYLKINKDVQVKSWFELKKLNKQLNNELNSDKINHKIMKV